MLQNDDRDTDPAQYEDEGFSQSPAEMQQGSTFITLFIRGEKQSE